VTPLLREALRLHRASVLCGNEDAVRELGEFFAAAARAAASGGKVERWPA
jgi:hypothetical protein